MGRKVTLATCTLNQWAMDFEGNYKRLVEGIKEAKSSGATYCLTSELSIPGYGCEDHFSELDTVLHSWEVVAKLLELDESKTMICDVGMPVIHRSVRYNCRVIFMYKKILLIRPKLDCCNTLNYRELRWFTPWFKRKRTEQCYLPAFIKNITGQTRVVIGDGLIQCLDTCIGTELCEELWTPNNTHIGQALEGVEIFTNGSGSEFNLRKLDGRFKIISSFTRRIGGVCVFSNQVGCDGGRVYYDGGSMIVSNGEMLGITTPFSLKEVDVCSATVDLDDVAVMRSTKSSQNIQNSQETGYPRIDVDFSLSSLDSLTNSLTPESPLLQWRFCSEEEELMVAPACWMWDYLRRSGLSGFFLPLSGGVDSASVACLVFSMCNLVYREVQNGNKKMLSDVRKVVDDEDYDMKSPEDFCNNILSTCYMASDNSSVSTKTRAQKLAERINSNHLEINIGTIVSAILLVFTTVTGFIPKFKCRGGSKSENLALQNIQARVRMLMAYLFAQMLQWVKGRSGNLLVLGSGNVDEAITGYYTKYDCSSADINPIGGISKVDLKRFILYFANKHKVPELKEIVEAPPTAELEPLTEGEATQTDAEDMGMTYEEISVFGRLRKMKLCGPYSMFTRLVTLWKDTCSPTAVAERVKHFFRMYSINRHKMTTLTPSMHAEIYSPDDNRYDLRQFLYNNKWTWQFRKIDDEAKELEAKTE